MAKIEIYTSPYCGFCHRAKALLKSKGIDFHEIDLASEPTRRSEMMTRAHGRYTVPQIFIDGQGIGGSDELHALERSGKLDELLG